MIGILIIARLGSTRLEQKHLIKAAGKTFIEWLVLRLLNHFKPAIESQKAKIILTTSAASLNRQFEEYLRSYPIDIFYGHDSNIPLRQLECAREKKLSHIINIDGDDILCSPSGAFALFEFFQGNSKINYAKTEGLPLGMNSMGYSVNYLEKCISNTNKETLETGWGRIFNSTPLEIIKQGNWPSEGNLRFTLDYPKDAEFFKAIIEHYQERTIERSDEELIRYVQDHKLFEINSFLNEEYWNNFNNQKKIEDARS